MFKEQDENDVRPDEARKNLSLVIILELVFSKRLESIFYPECRTDFVHHWLPMSQMSRSEALNELGIHVRPNQTVLSDFNDSAKIWRDKPDSEAASELVIVRRMCLSGRSTSSGPIRRLWLLNSIGAVAGVFASDHPEPPPSPGARVTPPGPD